MTPLKRTMLLLALAVAVAAVIPTAQSPETRSVDGFVAQVPANRTPRRPTGVTPLPAGHRQIHWRSQPILSELRPDDQVLHVIMDWRDEASGDNTDPAAEVRQIASRAHAVAVITVQGKVSEAIGAWIMSTISVKVEEVVKDRLDLLSAGQTLSIQEPGGTVQIGKQRIVASYPVLTPTAVGKRYLAALERTTAGEVRILLNESLEIRDGKLIRLRRDAPATWPLDRQSVAWLKSRIQQSTLRRPQ